MNEQAIQGQILADYIHLFTGLKKAIEMRDEEQDEDGDDQDEEEEEELNVRLLIHDSSMTHNHYFSLV